MKSDLFVQLKSNPGILYGQTTVAQEFRDEGWYICVALLTSPNLCYRNDLGIRTIELQIYEKHRTEWRYESELEEWDSTELEEATAQNGWQL